MTDSLVSSRITQTPCGLSDNGITLDVAPNPSLKKPEMLRLTLDRSRRDVLESGFEVGRQIADADPISSKISRDRVSIWN